MTNMVIMLIWMSTYHTGGGMVIQGFTSMESCQAAIAPVQETYKELNSRQLTFHYFRAICRDIPR